MTSADISMNRGFSFGLMENGSDAGKTLQKTKEAGFSKIFEKAGDNLDKPADRVSPEKNAEKYAPEDAEKYAKDKPADVLSDKPEMTLKTDRIRTKTRMDNEKPLTDEDMKAFMGAVSEAVDKMMSELAALLGVTPEDIKSALENLGFEMKDLLNEDAVAMLAKNILVADDPAMLLMNEDACSLVNKATELVTDTKPELTDRLDIKPEVLDEIISRADFRAHADYGFEAADSALTQPEFPEGEVTEEPVTEYIPKEADTEIPGAGQKQERTAVFEEISGGNQPVRVAEEEVTQKQYDIQVKSSPETEESVKITGPEKKESGDQKESSDDKQQLFEGETAPQFTVSAKNHLMSPEKISENEEIAFDSFLKEEVLNQIEDYIRVRVSGDTTELEMKLQPESLGSVNIHLASKEGVLTAQFTAENEAVKSVLEAQIITLRSDLEQQGIKVEAVEVTVAGHGFEQSFENTRQEQERASDSGIRVHRARRLNLADMSDEDEELTEAEQIAVDMMLRDGNTIDFTA